MFEYTKNNHIVTGRNQNNEFFFEYGKLAKYNTIGTWRSECMSVARELHEKHGNKLKLMLSGGVDSEVMLNSFIANGIKPDVLVLRYERNNNLHDINYILRTCTKNYIQPTIIDVNVEKFFEEKLLEFSKLTRSTSPQINLILYHAYHVDGIPVLATGENFLTRKYGETEVYDLENEKESRLYTFFKTMNREAVPAFFQYTPEQMVSFLQKEKIYRWVETARKNRYISTKKIKHSVIIEDFDVEVRPKLTGFELYPEQDATYRELLENQGYDDSGEVYTPFEEYIQSFGLELLREIKYET